MSAPRLIACLLYPEVMSLDVCGPLQVFASANVECRRQGLPEGYTLRLLADEPGNISTSAGFALVAEQAWADCNPAKVDTLLIPGGPGETRQCQNRPLLQWLCAAAPQIRRVGSVCSGALILAEAGLLAGLPATTHWADLASLQRHDGIQVQGDRLHTYDPTGRDGHAHIFTSAGVTAGIDLALALVESDLGRPLALAVARRLVMFLRRPGGQAQFGGLLPPASARTPRLLNLLEWMAQHLSADLSLEALAQRINLSPRSLSRLFLQELGVGPGRYVEQLRLEAARQLLQDSGASIGTVARLTGFRHPENLRRSFHKFLAVSPQDYAQRFA